jgi:hypothetical protein
MLTLKGGLFMKALLSVLVFVAGFAAHAAINTKSNADCKERQKGSLFSMGNTAYEPAKQEVKKVQPAAPVQYAQGKSKTQGT